MLPFCKLASHRHQRYERLGVKEEGETESKGDSERGRERETERERKEGRERKRERHNQSFEEARARIRRQQILREESNSVLIIVFFIFLLTRKLFLYCRKLIITHLSVCCLSELSI
jgi:hypothetical protein